MIQFSFKKVLLKINNKLKYSAMRKTTFIVLVALLAIVVTIAININSFVNFFMSKDPVENLYIKRALVIGLIAFIPIIVGLFLRWLFGYLHRKHQGKRRGTHLRSGPKFPKWEEATKN